MAIQQRGRTQCETRTEQTITAQPCGRPVASSPSFWRACSKCPRRRNRACASTSRPNRSPRRSRPSPRRVASSCSMPRPPCKAGRAVPLHGTYSVEEALQKVLGDSGLSYEFVGENVVAVKDAPVEDAEDTKRTALPEMTVTAKSVEGFRGRDRRRLADLRARFGYRIFHQPDLGHQSIARRIPLDPARPTPSPSTSSPSTISRSIAAPTPSSTARATWAARSTS